MACIERERGREKGKVGKGRNKKYEEINDCYMTNDGWIGEINSRAARSSRKQQMKLIAKCDRERLD